MFKRILLALDAGPAGAVATSLTVALARQLHAQVHVVHVSEYVVGGRGLAGNSPSRAADVVTDALRDMQAAGIGATGVTYRTTTFDVPTTIADVAAQWHADVIVVGSRRRRRLFRRSLRRRIARATPLPLLTAPAPLRVTKRPKPREAVPSLLHTSVRS